MPGENPCMQIAATVVLNLSIAVLIGACMAQTWLRKGRSPWAGANVPVLRRFAIGTLATAMLAYAMLLWLEAAGMAEVALPDAGPAVAATLDATHYGFAWKLGMCALVAVAVLTLVRWPSRFAAAAEMARLLALAGFLYTRSIVSHAGASGDVTWAVAADWVHLVLISLWIGEVIIAGFVTLRFISGTDGAGKRERAAYIEALSTSATVALIGIFITGAIAAWRGLGSVENAIGNPYATVLTAKLLLVASAAALGGANRFLVMPGLLPALRGELARQDGGMESRFKVILQVESLILIAALVLAAILSSTSPPTAG